MTNSEAARIVRTVLCHGLTFEQTEQILKAMVPLSAAAETIVFRENEQNQGLLVALEGTVEILKQGADGSDAPIATVAAPTVLGEMGLITDRPHSATIRAVTACEFRLLTRAQFDRLLLAESLAAYKVVATLAAVIAKRLNKMDEKVRELSRQPERATPVEELATFKHKLFNEWSI
jgi:CRP/FNR family cyclic AMP-dependent transcriptional regulator